VTDGFFSSTEPRCESVQFRLSELIRAINQARNALINLEELPEVELTKLEEQFRTISRRRGESSPKKPLGLLEFSSINPLIHCTGYL